MITILLIVTIILLSLAIFYIIKLRKSVSDIRLNQDLMADDIAKRIEDINQRYTQQYTDLITELREYKDTHAQGEELSEDDLYEKARELVIEAQKASTSFLQRALGVGYSRAAKLIDMLEDEEVIGPANGSKPREILLDDSSN